jgi:hypothetical protein
MWRRLSCPQDRCERTDPRCGKRAKGSAGATIPRDSAHPCSSRFFNPLLAHRVGVLADAVQRGLRES